MIPIYLLLLLFLVGCTDPSWKPPAPGTVVTERSNSDRSLSARVIATKVQGTYSFEVHAIKNKNVLQRMTISAPVGYHEHNVSLKWSKGGQTATATIDHDFGDDNKVFKIHILDSGQHDEEYNGVGRNTNNGPVGRDQE